MQSRGQSRGSHPQLDPQLDAHHAQLDEQPDPAGQEEPEASHEAGTVKEHGWPSAEAERSCWAKADGKVADGTFTFDECPAAAWVWSWREQLVRLGS